MQKTPERRSGFFLHPLYKWKEREIFLGHLGLGQWSATIGPQTTDDKILMVPKEINFLLPIFIKIVN